MVKIRSAIPCMELILIIAMMYPDLTRWLDKLPFYSTTKQCQPLQLMVKQQYLIRVMPHKLVKGMQGQIYIDDFEGTRSSIDLRFPADQLDPGFCTAKCSGSNGNILFPEATSE